MMKSPAVVAWTLALLCATQVLEAQGLAKYRDFELGTSLTTVSGRAAIAASAARTIHDRPAILQDLEWRPSRWATGASKASSDPVELVSFSFYNDQLYRTVVDYSYERTEGLTEADMVEALSTSYGAPVPRKAWRAGLPLSAVESDSGTPLARWTDAGATAVLYRTSSFRRPRFRLIVAHTQLHELARKAAAQALRLDDQEAPSREVARQKKELADETAAAEQARTVNKKTFRP